jgi:cytochrome c oxidase subunit 1
MSLEQREVIVSSVTEAIPELREGTPEPSIWPFLAAVAVATAFIASIFSPWAAVWGSALVGATIIGWFWPKSAKEDE